MKATIVSLSPRFKKWHPVIIKAFSKAGRVFNLRKSRVEVYLTAGKLLGKYFNVLAFPALKGFPRPDIKGEHLGEIYLNPDYIFKEKLEIDTERLAYMFFHGLLHLLGYDHHKEGDRIKMEKKEKQLLKLLGK